MTTTKTFDETLIDLVRARHSLILVETHEEDRVIAALTRLTTSARTWKRPRQLMTYRLSRGLQPAGGVGGRPQEPLAALQELTKQTEPTIAVVLDLHHFLGSGGRSAEPTIIRSLLDAAQDYKSGPMPHTVVLVAPGLTLPPELEKVTTVVDLPLPDADEIAAVLDDIVDANRDRIQVRLEDGERERLIQAARGLTQWEAENAFARAISADGVLDASDISLVMREKQQTIRKAGLLEFIPPSGTLDDIGGLENLKRWLHKRNNAWLDEAQQWSVPPPKGILITGVPGCGKSLTAKCMSSLWQLPLLRLDIGRVFAGLVGSSEQNMRGALKLAEAVSPSILWIDEIEKGFGSASGGGDSGTSQRVFGTFLTWMQEKTSPVFVVATANKIDSLPPEFLRKGRFDEIFFVDLPTKTERSKIWDLHLSRRLTGKERLLPGGQLPADLVDKLAEQSEGYSGAEIEQAVISACFDAYADRRHLQPEDLERSVANTVALSVTQAEQISGIREWAATRAVAATPRSDRGTYEADAAPEADVSSWRGGRMIDF